MTKGDGTRFLYIISIKEFFNNQYIKIVKCDEIEFSNFRKEKTVHLHWNQVYSNSLSLVKKKCIQI